MNPMHPPEGDPRPAPPRFYSAAQRIEAPIAHLVGLSCREFARLTVARLDRPLTRTEAWRHRLHGAMCGICSRFAAQFAVLHELSSEIETETAPVAETDSAAVDRIAAAVRAAANKPPR